MARKVIPPEMRLINPSVPVVDVVARTPVRTLSTNEGTVTGRISSAYVQGFRIMDREAGLPLGSDYAREEADRAFRRLAELNAAYPGRHVIKELGAADTGRKGWV